MKEYMSREKNRVVKMRQRIWEARENYEEGGVEEGALVEIYVPDSAGMYAMEEFTCMVTDMSEEEYEEKYFSEDGFEYELSDFDELLDEINEDVEKWWSECGFDKEFRGYEVRVGWWEGHIVMLLYGEA